MLKDLKNVITSIGKSLKEPVFLKDYEGVEGLITELETLKRQIKDRKTIEAIDLDVMLIKYGNDGERNVAYEIKNSFLPMYVIHGLTIQHEDYKAQLDFVLITSKFICILETKKLNGDITINNDGDFVRHFKNRSGKTIKKEGMYSPISQNQRHVRILKDMLIKDKIIKNCPVLSLVVIANPKSIINHKYAKKEIKNEIVKYDQLTPRIKKIQSEQSDVMMPIASMQDIGNYLVSQHVEPENAFITKYKGYVTESIEEVKVEEKIIEEHAAKTNPVYKKKPYVVKESSPKYKKPTTKASKPYSAPVKDGSKKTSNEAKKEKLTKFRLEQSRKENVKAYFIFNNKQLDDILEKMPKNEAELMGCNGFGKMKVDKYGGAILEILNE